MTTPRHAPQVGSFDTVFGVFLKPAPTMKSIVRRRPIGWAAVIIAVVLIAHGLIRATSLEPSDFEVDWLQRLYWTLLVIGGPAVGMVAVAIFTAVCWGMSRILGGRGSFGGLFSGLGFAFLPAVLTIPLSFMDLQLDALGESFSWAAVLVGLAVAVWTIILSVFAVQASSNFSTGRSISVVLVSLAITFFCGLALTVLLTMSLFVAAFLPWFW